MITIYVSDPSGISEARRKAVASVQSFGFDEGAAGKLALVVTEIATNLVKHAGGGQIFLRRLDVQEGDGIEVLGVDAGPGMSDVDSCIRDGHSSTGTSGTGLGAIKRLSAVSEIHSVRQRGTIVRAICRSHDKAPDVTAKFAVGYVSTPKRGEEACGDSVAYTETASGIRILVADGLGHGFLAAEASNAAVLNFRSTVDLDLTIAMDRMHLALRSTRGAAVGIAEILPDRGVVQFCGIGNIAGVITGGVKDTHLVSMSGIVGHQIRSVRVFEYGWARASRLTLHSDGLSSRWDLSAYSGLSQCSPAVIAAILYRDARRIADDSTVLVAAVR